MSIKKSIIIVLKLVGVLTLVVAVGIYVFFTRGITQDVEWLTINKVDVSKDSIIINAFNPDSGTMVSGYDLSMKENTVKVKLRGTLVNKFGDLMYSESIVMNGDFSSVNKVVLIGKTNQSKTIWSK